ncbi:MAG: conserved domain protein proline-rich [Firmicutes bacterium]|nr:conserved domain protein proline-rich [Bacillota bacterium]
MTWPLLVVGILLALYGLWGGPAPRRRERESSRAKGPIPKGDAWDILTQPVVTDEELIKLPERRPWFVPGRAGRFQRGLMLGLGLGLLIAAAIHTWAPRSVATQPPTAADSATKPPPGTTNLPTATKPPATPGGTTPTTPKPPTPTVVSFVVQSGDMVPTIAANLKAKGLIADDNAFVSRATERGADVQLKAGTFNIPTGGTLDQVIDALTK